METRFSKAVRFKQDATIEDIMYTESISRIDTVIMLLEELRSNSLNYALTPIGIRLVNGESIYIAGQTSSAYVNAGTLEEVPDNEILYVTVGSLIIKDVNGIGAHGTIIRNKFTNKLTAHLKKIRPELVNRVSSNWYGIFNKDFKPSEPKIYQLKSVDETKLDTNIMGNEGILDDSWTIALTEEEILNPYIPYDEITLITSDLVLVGEVTDRGTRINWSDTRVTSQYLDGSFLRDQIRTRYAMFDRPRSGALNPVIDAFVPRMLYSANLDVNRLQDIKIPATAVTISPLFANILGIRQLPVEELCAVLGYTIKDIRQLLRAVRSKQLHMTMVGFGGTSINTIYWLDQMSKMTSSIKLFKELVIYENDTLEFSNLLRLPVNIYSLPEFNAKRYSYNSAPSKLALLGNMANTLTATPVYTITSYMDATRNPTVRRDYNNDGTITINARHKYFTYGAPDIETRSELSKIGHFISATHADKTCRIDLNPEQDTNLQVESYGVISLGAFFMNQLRMAIGLLELLASDQDLMEQNKTILEYQFDGVAKLPTSRKYAFQLEHSGMLMDENEAQGEL